MDSTRFPLDVDILCFICLTYLLEGMPGSLYRVGAILRQICIYGMAVSLLKIKRLTDSDINAL